MALTDWTQKQLADHPAEAAVVKAIIDTLHRAGNPVTQVDYFEDRIDTPTRDDVLNIVFDLDESFLITDDGSWVRITLGNEWDCLTDYTVNLEEILQPVSDLIDRKYGITP